MRVRTRLLVLAGLALVAFVGTAAVLASPSGPWQALRRPLQLKLLAAGASCPVTPFHRLDRGRISGAGAGPIYPMPSPFGPEDRHPGWLSSKTIWTWPTRLKTAPLRVLVRGMRLDRPGLMRFELGPQWDTAPLTRELHLTTTEIVGSFSQSTWGTTVTLLMAREPGCYGLQLDSPQGTSTIVVRATR